VRLNKACGISRTYGPFLAFCPDGAAANACSDKTWIELHGHYERRGDCYVRHRRLIKFMFKRLLSIGVPVLIAVVALGLSSPFSFGKTEYSKKEGKGCAFCHVAAGKKDLNDVGKCRSMCARRRSS
jgi:hypothetical protein